MVTQKVKIKNKNGIHLRPAGVLSAAALKYDALITFRIGTTIANAKSSLSVLAAQVKEFDEIEFICEGVDEQEALECLVELVESGLGE